MHPSALPQDIENIEGNGQDEQRNSEAEGDDRVLGFPDSFESEPESSDRIVESQVEIDDGII